MSKKDIQVQLKLVRSNFVLDLDLKLPAKGVSVISGPSGSGKTTLLRCLAGLNQDCHGTITFLGELWQGPQFYLATHKRPIGYVFQEAALFDHLTAKGNLEFAFTREDTSHKQAFTQLNFQKLVEMLDLEPILNHYPAELSGGERQRVAIARALLINPRILLMDEPLASLDQARKLEILPYIENLKNELELPIIYITHSADELARLADHIVILEKGKLLAEGMLSEVLTRIDLPFMRSEDSGVVLEGAVSEVDSSWGLARLNLGKTGLWFKNSKHHKGDYVRIRILASDVSIALDKPLRSSIINTLPATVIELQQDSDKSSTLVKLKVSRELVIARLSSRSAHDLALAPGLNVWAQIKSVAIVS